MGSGSPAAAAASPACWLYTGIGSDIVYVDCDTGRELSVSYGPSASFYHLLAAAAKSKTATGTIPLSSSLSSSSSRRSSSTLAPSGFRTSIIPPPPSPSSSSFPSNLALNASSSAASAAPSTSATPPTILTTEGGVWISGGSSWYASASAAVSGNGTSAAAGGGSAADAGHAPTRPSPLPIILSCVFGALFLASATALFVLWHRRRKARAAGLRSPPSRALPPDRRRLFGGSRRASLAGSGAFSAFEPEEIDPLVGMRSAPDSTVVSSGGGGGAGVSLSRAMTTSEKQTLLREASRVERRAAQGEDVADDELALVRRKLDGWALLAHERRAARARGELVAPVVDESSPFGDAHAVGGAGAGLEPPPSVRLPLTITTALPSPRRAPVMPAARSETDGSSLFSYSHTPTELYPGPSPWPPAHPEPASTLLSVNNTATSSPSDTLSTGGSSSVNSHAPLLPQAPPPPPSQQQQQGQARQEFDAGHLAGVRRSMASSFGEDVQPPAYRW